MKAIDLLSLAAANDTKLLGDNALVNGVAIDSRQITKGDVFVALKGLQVDGHQYVGQALKNGAVAAVVASMQNVDIAQIVVADTQRALGVIAKVNRNAFAGKVVAITGSAGKTSCKNMVAAILSQVGKVCATQGNFNNEVGLPLTVQRLNESHDYAVLEMGAAKAGDIDYLARIGQPHISAITNINEAHLGGFGDIETTAKTKAEIYGVLPQDGFAIINRDDYFAQGWRELLAERASKGQVLDCSLANSTANIYASDIKHTANGTHFTANVNLTSALAVDGQAPASQIVIQLNLLGEHNIRNALMSIAIAKALMVSDSDIAKGLAEVKPAPGRLSLRAAHNDLMLLDDSYNANPQALNAAIDVLLETGSDKHKLTTIAVLGDMGELGDKASEMHYQLGQSAARKGVDRLYAVGEFAEQYIAGFIEYKNLNNLSDPSSSHLDSNAKAKQNTARSFVDQLQLIEHLLSPQCVGAKVLVKGSRSAAMDKVVEALATDSSEVDGAMNKNNSAGETQEKSSLC